MGYCQKCGKELEENDSFCGGCGSGNDGADKKINQNPAKIFLWIFVIGIIIVGVYFIYDGNITGKAVSNLNGVGKEACPSECCVEGEYKEKQCSQDYECVSNGCVAIDSDDDGLSNIEEKKIGTNPQIYDSDGDTLSDYKEVITLGTDPLDKNSDNDR